MLYSSYCLLHFYLRGLKELSATGEMKLMGIEVRFALSNIAKDAFRIVLYVASFYMSHCAVPRFLLKL